MTIIAIAIVGIGLTFWYSPSQLISRSTEGLASKKPALTFSNIQLYPSNAQQLSGH